MKNNTIRRIAALLLSAVLMTSLLPSFVSAGTTSSMNVSIRIEGISGNLYDQTLSIPFDTPTLSVQAALAYADNQSADIAITGLATVPTPYVTAVNGETAATFGPNDGWLFMVNSVSPSVGMDGYVLHNGDAIVLYYGDPFAVGIQYPEMDASKVNTGILKFTSQDTTYDKAYIPTITTNPVVGATVTWYCGSTAATFTTDANGEIIIPQAQLTAGSHRVQIEKYGTTAVSGKYLPIVLRLSKNASVTVTSDSSSSSSSGSVSPGSSGTPSGGSGNVPTGDSSAALLALGLILSLAALAVLFKRKKHGSKE